MLVAALAVLSVDQLALHAPVSVPTPRPSPSPSPPPHFALDDVDLGPNVRLTRFYPDFNISFAGAFAVEGGDGKLYVAYDPGRAPWTWGFTGENTGELSILDKGILTPVRLLPYKTVPGHDWLRVDLEGLWDGMPVVRVQHNHDDKVVYKYAVIGVLESKRYPVGRHAPNNRRGLASRSTVATSATSPREEE